MKKQVTLALLLLLAASPVAASGNLPIRANVQAEVKVEGQVRMDAEKSTNRLTDFSARLHRLDARLSALIKRLEGKNVSNLDATKKAYAEFKAKLEISDKSLAELSLYMNANATIKDHGEFNAKRKQAREDLQAAHKAMKNVVAEIAKAVRSIKVNINAEVRSSVGASAQSN